MAPFKPSEWSKAVQRSVAGFMSVGAIIGMYLTVEAWADDKISESERRQIQATAEVQARNDIDHDKIIQSARISQSETNIEIIEIKLSQLEDEIDERTEDGKEPTARQERTIERLSKLLETYEETQKDATEKLTTITTTTVTTTETRQ